MPPRAGMPGPAPPSPTPPHSRECSSSRAALAARSRPVGSKLLHLSLGAARSPAPRSPPTSAPGCAGDRDSGGSAPSPFGPLMPKSHDMARDRRVPPEPPGPEAELTRAAQSSLHTRRAGRQTHCAGARHAPSSPGRRKRVWASSSARPLIGRESHDVTGFGATVAHVGSRGRAAVGRGEALGYGGR